MNIISCPLLGIPHGLVVEQQLKSDCLTGHQNHSAVWCRHSIHAHHNKQEDLQAAIDDIPIPVPGTPHISYLVLSNQASFGVASYLIQRPEGNIIVDSPRFDKKLLRSIQVGPRCLHQFTCHVEIAF